MIAITAGFADRSVSCCGSLPGMGLCSTNGVLQPRRVLIALVCSALLEALIVLGGSAHQTMTLGGGQIVETIGVIVQHNNREWAVRANQRRGFHTEIIMYISPPGWSINESTSLGYMPEVSLEMVKAPWRKLSPFSRGAPSWVNFDDLEPPSDKWQRMEFSWQWATGWPWRAVRGEQVTWVLANPTPTQGNTVANTPVMEHRGMIELALVGLVPVLPIWPGLVLNLLTLAVPFLALQWLIGWRGNARRTRAGLCPVCKYDLTATPQDTPCPECGNAPTGRAASSRSRRSPTPD